MPQARIIKFKQIQIIAREELLRSSVCCQFRSAAACEQTVCNKCLVPRGSAATMLAGAQIAALAFDCKPGQVLESLNDHAHGRSNDRSVTLSHPDERDIQFVMYQPGWCTLRQT